jgi:hypothetical protein
VTPVERLYVVSVQVDLLASIRLLGPPSPEAEWAYMTLCDEEHELLKELTVSMRPGSGPERPPVAFSVG